MNENICQHCHYRSKKGRGSMKKHGASDSAGTVRSRCARPNCGRSAFTRHLRTLSQKVEEAKL